METKILLQQKSVVGIRFSVDKSFFPALAGLPDRIVGQFTRFNAPKTELRFSITWVDDQLTDVLSLRELLLTIYNFRLENFANGKGPPVLRGAVRREHERENAPVREPVQVVYMDGMIERVQVWHHAEPEAINEDARTAPRYVTKINRPRHTINTPFKMYRNAMYPPKLMALRLQYHNQRLAGNKADPKTTEGELFRLDGYKLAIGLHPGEAVEDMWRWRPHAADITPPPNMGMHGMSKDRFLRLHRLDGQLWTLGSEDQFSESADPWSYSLVAEVCFNEHMAEAVQPGSHLGPDESMAFYTGGAGTVKVTEIPVSSFVPPQAEEPRRWKP